MIIQFSKLFENLFADPKITPTRFRNFCRFVLNAMKADNADGKYDEDMVKITAVIEALDKELKEVASGVISQVNSTSEVDAFIHNFGQFMKNTAGAIAYALGGNTTSAYAEFYPHKNEEYLNATKTTMPGLSLRVFDAATKYAKELGTKLAGDLQSFATGYEGVLEKQQAQITTVKGDRKERNAAFTEGQWTLTDVVNHVAIINSRKPEQSKKLFPFDMLFPPTKTHIIKADGKLAAKESKEILNRTLSSRVKIIIRNTSLNADAVAWLAMLPAGEVPATAVLIKANSKIEIVADKLGDLRGTFLMIKNASDINEAAYEVEITGLSKTKEERTAEKKEKMEVVEGEKTA